jgi:hypothetical protein
LAAARGVRDVDAPRASRDDGEEVHRVRAPTDQRRNRQRIRYRYALTMRAAIRVGSPTVSGAAASPNLAGDAARKPAARQESRGHVAHRHLRVRAASHYPAAIERAKGPQPGFAIEPSGRIVWHTCAPLSVFLPTRAPVRFA